MQGETYRERLNIRDLNDDNLSVEVALSLESLERGRYRVEITDKSTEEKFLLDKGMIDIPSIEKTIVKKAVEKYEQRGKAYLDDTKNRRMAWVYQKDLPARLPADGEFEMTLYWSSSLGNTRKEERRYRCSDIAKSISEDEEISYAWCMRDKRDILAETWTVDTVSFAIGGKGVICPVLEGDMVDGKFTLYIANAWIYEYEKNPDTQERDQHTGVEWRTYDNGLPWVSEYGEVSHIWW